MLETIFLNPGYLAAGAALISAPIIIHLINRMRFKRLRWAAMEFLLKAQKRNRRRLIIEQLLLLLLRCTLVALVALLVSRLVERSSAAGQDAREFTHIVLLDDSLSMTDQWRDKDDNNKIKTAFGVAKDVIKNKILHTISRSSTNDKLMLLSLSHVVDEEKLQPTVYADLGSAEKRKEIEAELNNREASKRHLDMEKGLTAVNNIVKNVPSGRVVVHILSDLRASDWEAPVGKKLQEELKSLALLKKADKDLKIEDLKVIVRDTAHPYRGARSGKPGSHDNLAIVDFRPATRVAGKGMPVLFTLTLANYGAREAEVDVDFFDNVTGKRIPDIDLNPTPPLKLPPGGSPVTATFDKRFPGKEGQESYYTQIIAKVEDKRGQYQDALPEDNTRCAALEIRDKVPVLAIDGMASRGLEDQKDSFFIKNAIISIPGESNVVVFGHELPGTGGLSANALERADLSRYPAIFLLNVPNLTDAQIARLEKYVEDGGGVCFFMGPLITPTDASKFYNKKLYKDGTGLFPVPLRENFFPPAGEEPLKPTFTGYEQLLLREEQFPNLEAYPIFGQVFKEKKDLRKALRDFPIKRYFQVPRGEWKPEAGKVFELATLPNDQPVIQFQKAALSIFDEKLAEILKNREYKDYILALRRHENVFKRLVEPTSDKQAYHLGQALLDLVTDKGKKDDTVNFPDLTEFWNGADPKVRSLRDEILQLRSQVMYGDPFVVLRHHGAGKVVAVMTTAGKEWNEWAGGSESSIFYQPFIWETLNYLTSAGAANDTNRFVGDTVQVSAELDQYRQKGRELKIATFYQEGRKEEPVRPVKEFSKPLRGLEGLQTFAFTNRVKTGFFLTHLLYEDDPDEARPLAAWAHAFNVDTARESKLARVSGQEFDSLWTDKDKEAKLDELLRVQGADDSDDARGQANERPWDFSESPWFFLLFLGILVAEQALAVHLSFHLKQEKGEIPTVVVRPQSRAAA